MTDGAARALEGDGDVVAAAEGGPEVDLSVLGRGGEEGDAHRLVRGDVHLGVDAVLAAVAVYERCRDNASPRWVVGLWLLMALTSLTKGLLGFALPVASPMQAIVFGTGRIPVRDMVRVGIWLDVVGIVLIALLFGW